jgi:hypothetical protein
MAGDGLVIERSFDVAIDALRDRAGRPTGTLRQRGPQGCGIGVFKSGDVCAEPADDAGSRSRWLREIVGQRRHGAPNHRE